VSRRLTTIKGYIEPNHNIFEKENFMQWFQGKKLTQIEIDSHPDGYVLFERVDKSTAEWSTLLLTKTHAKERWEFGWNGDRLSNGHNTKSLITHDPSIHRWVLDALKCAKRSSQ
jgi:hypothetical protein